MFFGEIIRNKNIILSKKEEKLLGEVGLFSDTNSEVFNMFDNADVKFKPVDDGTGNKVDMSHGVYGMLLQNQSQDVRKEAFESMFGAYKDHINMLAANYAGNVKKIGSMQKSEASKARSITRCIKKTCLPLAMKNCLTQWERVLSLCTNISLYARKFWA